MASDDMPQTPPDDDAPEPTPEPTAAPADSCPHGHPHHGEDEPVAMDAAQQSLADALRASFRVLSVLMVLVVVVYLFTGVVSVPPQQVGILKVFGRTVGVAREGLAYTWPFPIGEIELVSTKEQELTVREFWMHELAEDKAKQLSDRSGRGDLRPGWDGALLTGDRNLLHAELTCTYVVTDPEIFQTFVQSEANLKKIITAALCRSAVRAAAFRTADGIQRTGQSAFKQDIRRWTQEDLDTLWESPGAVEIRRVDLRATWPLATMSAFIEAQKASNDRKRRIDEARAKAAGILNSTCGPRTARVLVGNLRGALPLETSAGPPASEKDEDGLILRYEQALRGGEAQREEAETLLDEIGQALLSQDTSGEAKKLLRQAGSERDTIAIIAEQRYRTFASLVQEYRAAREFFLSRHWATTVDEILAGETVEKFILSPGQGKTILKITSDPSVLKRIKESLLKRHQKELEEADRARRKNE